MTVEITGHVHFLIHR